MFEKLKATLYPQASAPSSGMQSTNSPEYIIVGLGNPEAKYEHTRHNAGFMAIDRICQKSSCKTDKLKFKSINTTTEIAGKKVLLMKPSTYMNNSGEAVREAMQFYKIPPEKVIIIFDDISLEIGKLRIKRKGSDGGHNGIKNIIYLTGKDNFPRIKLGVGKKPHPDYDLAAWVLSKFTDDELKTISPVLDSAFDAAVLILNAEIDKAMNLYN